MRGRCLKDDKEGWITTKGNAGTLYVEASSKHYCMIRDSPLHKACSSSRGEVMRQLESGEALEALEKPKEETFPSEMRVKVRTVSDGAVGWITRKQNNVEPWKPYYK